MSNVETGSRIKEIRKAKHLTQKELASILLVNDSYIPQIEKGTKALSHEKLILLAVSLNINLHYLLTGKGEPFLSESTCLLPDDTLKIKVKKGQKLFIEYEED